jgi:nucleotidyltransferase substrate binding protein (TIGR01987 family)
VDHLLRTAATLEEALAALERTPVSEEVLYDLFRNAAIKSFELLLETAGKLLRKVLKAYSGNLRSVDALVFNDVLRPAGRHGLLDQAGVERWLAYRSNRNSRVHNYGEAFAKEALALLPAYLQDLRPLALKMKEVFDAAG